MPYCHLLSFLPALVRHRWPVPNVSLGKWHKDQTPYVNGPECLLHPIRGNKIRYACKFMEKSIFESEKRSWSDDCCFGEDLPHDLLTTSLARESAKVFHLHTVLYLTFVRKNSDDEFLLALYEETWTNRSTSYLATASEIRSAPSTWTSSRVKFL